MRVCCEVKKNALSASAEFPPDEQEDKRRTRQGRPKFLRAMTKQLLGKRMSRSVTFLLLYQSRAHDKMSKFAML
jgi:hypothetical protein